MFRLIQKRFLSTIVATKVSPVTFTTVLSISKGLSIPIIIAIPSGGIPTVDITIIVITRLAPGTPAVPIEAKTVTNKTVNI